MGVSFNIPILGEVRVNWAAEDPVPVNGGQEVHVDQQEEAEPQVQQAAEPQHPAPVVVPLPLAAAAGTVEQGQQALPQEAGAVEKFSEVSDKASSEKKTDKSESSSVASSASSSAPVISQPETGAGLVAAAARELSEQQEQSFAQGEPKREIVTGTEETAAAESVNKKGASSPLPQSALSAEKSARPEKEISAEGGPAPVPAGTVLRDIPAMQDVIRANIEDRVSEFPALAAQFHELSDLLSAYVEEKQASELQGQLETLLNVLIPVFSQEEQDRFVSRLKALYKEIVGVLEGHGWNKNCSEAATKLLAAIEQLSHEAFEGISTILGTHVPSQKEQTVQAAAKGEEEASPTVVRLPGGWNRKHRRHFRSQV